MRVLRGPGGCAWDRQQTHRSLAPYLLEEAYETLEAIESDDPDHLCEELGDLLLQVVFHCQVAQEDGAFDISSVAHGIRDKLVARHPHVFDPQGPDQLDAAAVEHQWERLKSQEKQRRSVLDGIPVSLPALQRAQKVLSRSAGQVPGSDKALVGQVPSATEAAETPAPRLPESPSELGEALLRLVAHAQDQGWDAEQSLRDTVREVESRIRATESPGV
jgi:XTP/dITP diphosphohydrolase